VCQPCGFGMAGVLSGRHFRMCIGCLQRLSNHLLIWFLIIESDYTKWTLFECCGTIEPCCLLRLPCAVIARRAICGMLESAAKQRELLFHALISQAHVLWLFSTSSKWSNRFNRSRFYTLPAGFDQLPCRGTGPSRSRVSASNTPSGARSFQNLARVLCFDPHSDLCRRLGKCAHSYQKTRRWLRRVVHGGKMWVWCSLRLVLIGPTLIRRIGARHS
jgi:hypothetical protein